MLIWDRAWWIDDTRYLWHRSTNDIFCDQMVHVPKQIQHDFVNRNEHIVALYQYLWHMCTNRALYYQKGGACFIVITIQFSLRLHHNDNHVITLNTRHVCINEIFHNQLIQVFRANTTIFAKLTPYRRTCNLKYCSHSWHICINVYYTYTLNMVRHVCITYV